MTYKQIKLLFLTFLLSLGMAQSASAEVFKAYNVSNLQGETVEGSGTITWLVGNETSGTAAEGIEVGLSAATVSIGSGLTVENVTYFDTQYRALANSTASRGE